MAKSKTKEEKSHSDKHKSSSKDKSKKDKKDKKSEDKAPAAAETSNGIDPTLDSLFSHSSGPVKPRAVFSTAVAAVAVVAAPDVAEDDGIESPPEDVALALAASRDALTKQSKKKRKRDTTTAVENDYLDKIIEEGEKSSKKQKKGKKNSKKADNSGPNRAEADSGDDAQEEGDKKDAMDVDEKEADETAEVEKDEEGSESAASSSEEDEGEDNAPPPTHESLDKPEGDGDVEKAKRTIFIGNLPPSVITSKEDYKALQSSLKSHGTLESIRFRSIAFSDLIPRKAAFITKAFHTDIHTVNAYAVFKKAEGARNSLKLNGKVLLDRHLRIDSIAHPSKNDSKRSVFVGNLDFEACEESLWRHFGSCGDVENVRIVRDPKTNVGKGIAYVTFADATSVDAALLLNEKPMKDVSAKDEQAVKSAAKRKLRVLRSKNLSKKHHTRKQDATTAAAVQGSGKKGAYVPKLNSRQVANLGRAGKLLGRAGAARMKKVPGGADNIVFEGVRASRDTDPGIKKGGRGAGKEKGKPRVRARSTAWKQKARKA